MRLKKTKKTKKRLKDGDLSQDNLYLMRPKPTWDLLCSTLSACRSSNRGLTLLNIFLESNHYQLTPKQMIMKPMFSLFVSFVICQSNLQFMTFDMACELPESDRLGVHYYC